MRGRSYIFLPLADADIDDIWGHIALDNERAAEKVVRGIFDAIGLLADSPLMGKRRPELAKNIRSFAVGSYIIFYQSFSTRIEIVRILYGARDIESLSM